MAVTSRTRAIDGRRSLDLVVDNDAAHKHPKVRAWLARRERCHVHDTPTCASWINQVERWFGLVTQQAIRRGSFSNVKEPVRKINAFVEHYDARTSPFVMVRHSRLDPCENRKTLLSCFRDAALASCCFLPRRTRPCSASECRLG